VRKNQSTVKLSFMMLHIMSTNLTSISLACSVQSRRYWGAFGGLASPNKAPSPPPIET